MRLKFGVVVLALGLLVQHIIFKTQYGMLVEAAKAGKDFGLKDSLYIASVVLVCLAFGAVWSLFKLDLTAEPEGSAELMFRVTLWLSIVLALPLMLVTAYWFYVDTTIDVADAVLMSLAQAFVVPVLIGVLAIVPWGD